MLVHGSGSSQKVRGRSALEQQDVINKTSYTARQAHHWRLCLTLILHRPTFVTQIKHDPLLCKLHKYRQPKMGFFFIYAKCTNVQD